MGIKEILKRRKIRRLAEKCLANQIVYSSEALQDDQVKNAISTAERFYKEFDERYS